MTRRESVARAQPQLTDVQDLQVVESNSGLINDLIQVQFLRPLVSRSLGGAEQAISSTSTSLSMIWAVHSSSKPSGTRISQHTAFGQESRRNLVAAKSALPASGSAGGFVINNDRQNYVQSHGVLMTIAWLVAAPLGVAVARFGKAKLGVWWFRIHVFLMFVCVEILSSIGLALAVVSVESVSEEAAVHFSPATYLDPIGGAHVIVVRVSYHF